MPPKRKRRVSKESRPVQKLRQSILTANDPSWGWVGTQVTRTSDITAEHLMACCGLSKHNNRPFCQNQYLSTFQNNFIDVDASPAQDDDVIVVSDDESNLPCIPKTCKSNPNCLNYLGQEHWEDEDDSIKAFMKTVALGRSPSVETRKPNVPTGLKNLGATCYANASLQVWFRDLAFRTGVYNCEPPLETDIAFKDSPIFQLQVTFAALQKSVRRAFNPTKLVESLQLDTTEQQDAQEFSKLFMSHLDTEFKKQANPQVRSLVTDQASQLVYVTVCSQCQYRSERVSDFLEIEINLEKKSILEERIAAALHPEALSGDNQYFCPQCECLQNATRYTELQELPPVLHFSLLRFVYDKTTMERKKSKHSISFPTTLDMNPFLSRRGQGPKTQGNLDNTYELCGILLHIGSSAHHGHYEAQVYDDVSWFQFNDETVTRVNPLKDKKKEMVYVDVNDPDVPHPISREKQRNVAYTRKRRRTQSEESSLESQIVNTNPSHNKFVLSKDAYMLIYTRKASNTPKQPSPVTPSFLVPEPPSNALKIVAELNDAHLKLCQSFAEKEELMRNQFRERRRKVMDIYSRWNVSSNNLEDSILVSRQSLQAWLTQYRHDCASTIATSGEEDKPVETCISMNEITCPHGAIDPAKASNIKRIRRDAYLDIVRFTGWEFKPSLTVADICTQCVEHSFRERLYQLEHPRLVANFERVEEAASHEAGLWISKAWLKDWKLMKPKMHRILEGDPSPGSAEFISDVLCEHDNLAPNTASRLRISEKAAELLHELFPSWNPVSTESEPCAICRVESRTLKKSTRDSRKMAEDEKVRLMNLYDAAISRSTMSTEESHYVLVPATFIEAWSRWACQPATWPRPESIDDSSFFCEHKMLLLDVNSPDLESSAMLIRRSDWDVLETLYPCGPLVTVEKQIDADGEKIQFSQGIPVCADCRSKRIADWTSTEITVRTTGTRRGGTNSKDSYELPLGVRQSRRLRTKELGEKRILTISKSTTVKEIKIMLQDELNIPTICQRLFHHSQELLDNNATAETLGVFAHDALELQQVHEINEPDAEGDSGGQELRSERGFGGTLLGSRDSTVLTSNSELHNGIQKSCKACTFSNDPDALKCTICDTYFTE